MNQEDKHTFNSKVYDALSEVAADFEINHNLEVTKEDFQKAIELFLNRFFN